MKVLKAVADPCKPGRLEVLFDEPISVRQGYELLQVLRAYCDGRLAITPLAK